MKLSAYCRDIGYTYMPLRFYTINLLVDSVIMALLPWMVCASRTALVTNNAPGVSAYDSTCCRATIG